jgi:hypothetical protein
VYERPRDPNQLAKAIVDEATDEERAEEQPGKTDDGKNPAAVALGRLGGKKGGKARAEKLTLNSGKRLLRKLLQTME